MMGTRKSSASSSVMLSVKKYICSIDVTGWELRKNCNESLQDYIFDFEQRLDNLREEIKDYALWLGEEA